MLLFDGLTKRSCYPGWRVGWVVGPSALVETIARAASATDAGPSRCAQSAALAVLEPKRADQGATALRDTFCKKHKVMVKRHEQVGVGFAAEPDGTFYCWGSLEKLPRSCDDSLRIFRQALQPKVLTVPGPFCAVNPGGFRKGPSPFTQWMRFSFGPPVANMVAGLDRPAAML